MSTVISKSYWDAPLSLHADLTLRFIVLQVKQFQTPYYTTPSPNASFHFQETLAQLKKVGTLGLHLLEHFPAEFVDMEYKSFERLIGQYIGASSHPDSFHRLMLNLQNEREKMMLDNWVRSWELLLRGRNLVPCSRCLE